MKVLCNAFTLILSEISTIFKGICYSACNIWYKAILADIKFLVFRTLLMQNFTLHNNSHWIFL